MDKTLILLSDYGTGDPAFTEVMLRLRSLLPDAYLHPQSVPPFSTVNTGYWIYQIAMTKDLTNTFIFSNTAPRKEEKKAQENNKGEKMMYAKLKNGFEIMAINAGYAFSFVKPHIEAFHYANCANEGSQFRSRDIYPFAVAKMMQKDTSVVGEKEDVSIIPDYPRDVIASIDGYGNIKTTTRLSEVSHFTPGQKLIVTLNHEKHVAIFTDGVFNIHEGELAFAPGSTGHDDKFMELFVRGSSAYHLFELPQVEDPFIIQPQ
jgi:S-adenosylmethionine hydrolase